ncbi:regulator of Vps4 activity in the MVB pathway-domain-containing protein [Mycena capillaripes]|nr:regulator of Vps4 activity in the MVB pathway-domain-containing protein [Mycena capillaripes]
MAARWDPTSVKALLRLTSQRLGQLQEKKDSKASITRRDIATLLQQGNVGLARTKAQNLIQEDVSSDLLEILEMHIGVVLEHFTEIDQQYVNSPVVLEAASSIIFAGASQTESQELEAVRDLLIQRLGEDFARSAVLNRDHHVSSRVVHALSAPAPSAANLDMYLLNIAKSYGVQWVPEPRRQDILIPLSEILDPETSPAVDMPRLRKLCSRGIPDEPAWLRARVWKLFFGTLPVLKASWSREARQQRESYYDLVRRLLRPFSELPPPTTPLVQLDASLFTVSKQLSRIPVGLFGCLSKEPEHAGVCPLDENAPNEIKIPYANILDIRLKAIQDRDSSSGVSASSIPEIRLESDLAVTPEISISAPESFSGRRQNIPKTLVTSRSYNSGDAHPKHLSALFRILYLHSMINPGNLSPHIPALLVPLYSVLSQEIEAEDQSNVEADTFWLFEAMIGEFAELEDEEGGNLWMRKFGDRVTWADRELAETLHVKGLDPGLPHYSYRWLAPLLTQTLPLSSVLVIWDALFSCPMRERDRTPKLEYLLDICTAMLIRARTALFRLGKNGRRSPSLWSEENTSIPPPSPLRAWEFGDAFVEGMSLLQLYPIEAAGGIDRLLQTASDLAHRRQEEAKVVKPDNLTLGARLKTTMWRGFTNQMPSPDISPPESEDQQDDEDERSEAGDDELSAGLTARLASTVWRGITNKSSMEPPPTPLTPISPMPPPSPIRSPWPSSKEEELEPQSEAPVTATIWNYAEKLKDSDAAAALAKVSSNWRARALMGTWGIRGATSSPNTPQGSPQLLPVEDGFVRRTDDGRHASLPIMHRPEIYSPPTRPAFFRPPRDSVIGPPRSSSPPTSPMWSPQSEGGFLSRTRNLQDSFAALTGSSTPAPPAPKSGPRPLLLNSSTLITAPSHRRPGSVSEGGPPAADGWQHVPRGKGHNLQRDSQSSASSLSPLDAVGRGWKPNKSELNPDANIPSRRVALNRRSVSPMAPISRIRPTSGSSTSTSPDRGGLRSPTRLSVVTGASEAVTNGTTSNMLGLSLQAEDTTESEAPSVSPRSEAPPRSPRIRSKRYNSRPANIRTEDPSKPKSVADLQPSPQSLDWPEQTQDATVATPKATTFDDASPGGRRKSSADQARKMSGDGQESRIRKVSGGSRSRKISASGTIKAVGKSNRDSAAEEGDDEGGGYGDLLSAYESEG